MVLRADPRIFLCFGFVAISLLMWIIYAELWHLPSYFTILSILTVIHFALGLWLLIMSRFTWRIVFFVVVGIIIGEWWLIQLGIMFLFWGIRGFAP
jgi:hypothetical protein